MGVLQKIPIRNNAPQGLVPFDLSPVILHRPLGAFYRNSWAPPRRGLRREVTQCFTVGFGALDGRARNLGWSRNSAAECFHDGSGRPQKYRPLRTPLPHQRPRGKCRSQRMFSPTAADCRVSENGGYCGEVLLEGSRGRGWLPVATGTPRMTEGGRLGVSGVRRARGCRRGPEGVEGIRSRVAESPQMHSKSPENAHTNPRMT